MNVILGFIYLLLLLFLLCLMIRVVHDWIKTLTSAWNPKGIIFYFFNLAFKITNPVILKAQKMLPPLRIGNFSLDLSLIALFMLVNLLMNLINSLI